jgi:glycosyltransferase involved in cell wall biosynthesis
MPENLLEKTKIVFVIPDLYSGGAQRVFTNLIKAFSRERFDITLVTLIKPNNEHFTKLIPSDIRFVQYNFRSTKEAFIPLISLIRKIRPRIVFSTLTHLNLILAFVKFFVQKNILFVARESNTISSSLKDEKYPVLFRFFYRHLYRNFDLIICQSKAMAIDLIDNLTIPESSIQVIYNPVDFEYVASCLSNQKKSKAEGATVELLCVGRLEMQKGYDRLLKILALLNQRNFHFRLRIVGDGTLKSNLESIAESLGLGANIEFMGIQENPFQFMMESHCLLLPSYYEGLPNVVIEANYCGLPVIAFNSPGGTAELIEEGLNGYLIQDGDLESFASAIQSKAYLHLNKEKIIKFVDEKYSLRKITSEYERAILDLSARVK